jgi:hypothetical protein
VIEHPEHAVFVDELAEGSTPETLMERCFYGAVGGEFFEEGVDLFVGTAIQTEEDRITGFGVCAEHIGAHDQGFAVFREAAVEDIGAHLGGHLRGHRGLGHFLEAEVAAEALLVKGEGFAAKAVEVEVGDDLRVHGFFIKAIVFLRRGQCAKPSIKGVVYDSFRGYL